MNVLILISGLFLMPAMLPAPSVTGIGSENEEIRMISEKNGEILSAEYVDKQAGVPGLSGRVAIDAGEELRMPTEKTMEELRAELVYEQAPDQSPSLFERIRSWIYGWIRSFFNNRVADNIITYAWYLFFGILLLFAIVLFFRSEINAVFKVRDSRVQEGVQNWAEEEIEGRDFLKLAGESADAGDYRTALRYRYLHLIQMLADRGHITWRADKTNHDYLRELAVPSLKEAFRYMTYLFNYTWYGHFDLDEATYRRAVESLKSVEKEVAA